MGPNAAERSRGNRRRRLAAPLLVAPEQPLDVAHIFVTEREELEARLRQLFPLLGQGGFIWVSWPKKASKVATDITEDRIRDICLPMGLVDVKVCAVDETWSALKLMRRRSEFLANVSQ